MYDIIVIGSGISSLSFFESFKPRQRKVAVISYKNYRDSQKIEIEENVLNKKNLPPRFSENIQNLEKANSYFTENNIIFDKNTSIFGYLDEGGVSNFWGGSCQFPSKQEINFLFSDDEKKNFIKSFYEIYKKFNFTGFCNFNGLGPINLSKDRDKILLNIIKSNDEENIKFYENLIAYDNLKKLIFAPKNFKLNTDENIIKLNHFVTKIKKDKDIFLVECLENNNKKILKTKKLVLATGTLVTTKLICDMLNYLDKDIKIKHNPMLFGLFIMKEKIKKNDNFLPSMLAAEIKNTNLNYASLANFRGSNKMIKEKIFNYYSILNNFIFKKIYDFIDDRFLFVNLYLDSVFSNLYLKNTIKKSIISTLPKDNSNINRILNDSFNLVYKSLKKKKLIYPFKYKSIPPIGHDNHYTGTIPINGKNDSLSLTEGSELINHNGLYIIDGSAIPQNNSKFPTALIIANAYRIGKKI